MKIIMWSVCLCMMASCIKNDKYEQSYAIKNETWKSSDTAFFEVNIPDTIDRYNVYLTLRRSITYGYANLWINIQTLIPNATIPTSSDIELTLEEKSGKPTGNIFGQNVEHLILIQNRVKMQAGIYKFWISQKMRETKLANILNIGVRIEKTQ